MPSPRHTCPHCDREFLLRGKGFFPPHGPVKTGRRCPGSGTLAPAFYPWPSATRRRLDPTREARILKMKLPRAIYDDQGQVVEARVVEMFAKVGLFPDGTPGEVFLTVDKEGSLVSGLAQMWALAISIGVQFGVPLKVYTDKMRFQRFEPSGMTHNPEKPTAYSFADYLGWWLQFKFGPMDLAPEGEPASETANSEEDP